MNLNLASALILSVGVHLMMLYCASRPFAVEPVELNPAPKPRIQISFRAETGRSTPVQDQVGKTTRDISQNITQPGIPTLSGGGLNFYWPTSQLDQPPTLIDEIPENPTDLEHTPEGGRLILILLIGRDGSVEKSEIEQSDLSATVTAKLVDLFVYRKFRPGVLSGVFVRSRMRIEITLQGIPALTKQKDGNGN